MGGLERAPQAPRARRAPGDPGRSPSDMGGLERAPQAPRARRAPGDPGRFSIVRQAPRVWLGIAWSLFQLYTAYAGLFDLLIQLPVHVAFAVALGFLSTPIPESAAQAERLSQQSPRRWLDGFLALAALGCAVYYIVENPRLTTRMAMVDDPARSDVVVGVIFTLLLLEATRRHTGPALVVLSLAFVAYAFAGPWLPGFLSHGGESVLKLIDQQTLTTGGIFGIPTLVSATFIYLFVVFGGAMSHGGLLRFFTDAALAVAGGTRGGAGKVAVISSGLFGTVNGSAIANAVTTGAFTIPLMMKAGYRPHFAAGVEACASIHLPGRAERRRRRRLLRRRLVRPGDVEPPRCDGAGVVHPPVERPGSTSVTRATPGAPIVRHGWLREPALGTTGVVCVDPGPVRTLTPKMRRHTVASRRGPPRRR